MFEVLWFLASILLGITVLLDFVCDMDDLRLGLTGVWHSYAPDTINKRFYQQSSSVPP